jgi:phosphoserine phosphatase RsbU/P
MVDTKRQTILTVDDEDAVRWSIRFYLEDCGYRVLEAEDGRAGLEIFERERPDLVLADLRMPEMDGLELLREILASSPQTPVIIISGTGVLSDAIEAIRLGAWDYVLKPIRDMAVLGHTINRSLEQARLRRENQEYQRHLEQTLRRLRESEEAGRMVQMRLLPPASCTFGPYSMTREIIPSAYLSGDFVDYFDVNDDHVAFYTADVSGHGVSSALVTVLLKSFMRNALERYRHQVDDVLLQPGPLLGRLNTELLEQNLPKHVTLFYGVLSVTDNTLAYSSGGQFPLPFLWHDGKADRIRESGPAVGLFPFAKYRTVHASLPPEFLAAIFSDGVLDALPQQGLEPKQEFLESLGSAARIESLIAEFRTNKVLPDDVTVLTIRKGGSHE